MPDHTDTPRTSRRRFLALSASAAATASLSLASTQAAAAVQGNNTRWAVTSDPALWQQAWARRFTNVLPNPLAAAGLYKPTVGASDYTIHAAQGTANVLGVPGVLTTVWGYHNQETGPTFPGRTLQVSKGVPITVHWVNRLVNASGQALSHILPIDQTMTIQAPTTGVPLAVHHHGSNSAAEFDGGPDQWATPLRRQTGPGITGNAVQVGTAEAVTYVYDNNQEASLHWYHDHAESLTGVNVQAGLAGLYVVRDANETALQSSRKIPAPQHEVALVLQDRTFDAQGQFVYSANPANSPTPLPGNFPASSPSHMPEVFGDVVLVNGKAWPVLSVEPRPYRLRLLNGSDSRFFTLKNSASNWVPMYVIGTDVGLLNNPVKVGAAGLTIAPGERYDVVIDFSWGGLLGGNVDLLNSAATPFPLGGPPSAGTASVMRFKVGLLANLLVPKPVMSTVTALRGSNGTATLPAALGDTAATPVRRILLGEGTDEYGRINPMLGVYDPTGVKNLGTLGFNDPVTETPQLGSTEIWEFWNATVDAHPVHLHLVKFRIKNRQAFTGTIQPTAMSNGWTGVQLQPGATTNGALLAPAAIENGWKDTVICPPGQVTRIVMTFDKPGKFVYHCHILSHEDHDMMRWFQVTATATVTGQSPIFGSTTDGVAFADPVTPGQSLTGVGVRSGSWLDGIQGVTSSSSLPAHGVLDARTVMTSLASGEHLVRMLGSTGTIKVTVAGMTLTGATQVTQLTFVTNTGRSIGPFGGGNTSNAFGNPQTFDYSVPSGTRIQGFTGRSDATSVYAIGVIYGQ